MTETAPTPTPTALAGTPAAVVDGPAATGTPGAITVAANDSAIQQTQQAPTLLPELNGTSSTASSPAAASFAASGPLADAATDVFAQSFSLAATLGELAPAGGDPSGEPKAAEEKAVVTTDSPEQHAMALLREFWRFESGNK
ncbi:MAG: hypothetical protein FJX55_16500 [Alphaproteobacteria bacterium]|nr:hypothetical protein [Alphaproteobacteria bacterium]